MQQFYSPQHNEHILLLTNALRSLTAQFSCDTVYFETRANAIIRTLVGQATLASVGCRTMRNKGNVSPYDKLDRVIVVFCASPTAFDELQEISYLVKNVYMLNLNCMNEKQATSFKLLQIRKATSAYRQINLDFYTYLDKCHFLSSSEEPVGDQETLVNRVLSMIFSYDKVGAFELLYKNNNQKLAEAIQRSLKERLKLLEKHSIAQQSQAVRVKLVIIDRKQDLVSPLMYQYYYGCISQELQLRKTLSPLFHQLSCLGILDAMECLQGLAGMKVSSSKSLPQDSKDLEFQKVKELLNQAMDSKSSPQEIKIHLEAMGQIDKFCRRKAATARLMQTVAVGGYKTQKFGSSKIVQVVQNWMRENNKCISGDDYMKMLMMVMLTTSLWFYQRSKIDCCISLEQEKAFQSFRKKIKGHERHLEPRLSSQSDFDQSRHRVEQQLQAIIQSKNTQFQKIEISKSLSKKATKVIFYMHGPLGFNQLCVLRARLAERKLKNYSILCQKLLTTNDYYHYLLNQFEGFN